MQQLNQLVFSVAIFLLCLYGMIVVHESGHAIGALLTGGVVARLVIHPFSVSQVYLASNPYPLIVVWCGPVLGCVIPVILSLAIPSRLAVGKQISLFFVGVCFLLNGAYIAAGPFTHFGDCGEMLRTGTPLWVMVLFGAVFIFLGGHTLLRIGSLSGYLRDGSAITRQMAAGATVALVLSLLAGSILSPR